MKSREYYKLEIIKMLMHIFDIRDIRLIYGMTLSAYNDLQKGGAL